MALPTDDNDLEKLFENTEYSKVASENNVFVDQAATEQYSVFEFKDYSISNYYKITISCRAQTSLSPAVSPVYLQIYNQGSRTWETIDTYNMATINENFTLSGVVDSDVSNYYGEDNYTSCRVYQKMT